MDVPIRSAAAIASPSIEELANAWRGECLQLYSAGERIVSECLEAVRDTDLDLSKESSHPGFKARARSLLQVLQESRFKGHSRKAQEYLAEWNQLYDRRVWLAHGEMHLSDSSVIFRYCDYSSGQLAISSPEEISVAEMRARLDLLRASLKKLEQQLGQISAACRRGDT